MNPQPFDLAGSPLKGRNLIEAGAGTGKTYTLAGLFVRLIVEKDLRAEEILVVSFTEAATAELKGRIRRQVKEALDAFTSGESDHEFLKELLDRGLDRGRTAPRLAQALRDFDRAAIFTIHGFCQRV
ncbi:MAG: UvrD-helicase domain-containing protein, partial [Thermodesulfobacteriota bacterium]